MPCEFCKTIDQHSHLCAEIQRLTGVADRANKSMEKHMKRNGALEISLQDAHRDTDAAHLQNSELKAQVETYRNAWNRAEGFQTAAERLVGELREHAFNQTLTDTSRVIRIQGVFNREERQESLKRVASSSKCLCKCHGVVDHNGDKIVCACCVVGLEKD